jgi:hypothetical protein
MEEKITYPFRINNNNYKKLKKIAENSNRTVNLQLNFIVENFIKDYEKVTGEIKIEDDIKNI